VHVDVEAELLAPHARVDANGLEDVDARVDEDRGLVAWVLGDPGLGLGDISSPAR
jgi:hypothetical protein